MCIYIVLSFCENHSEENRMDSIKNLKEIAAYENLPWELTEEILSRVSPKSLVRFRVVCKRWKATLDDKNFIYKHKDRRRFDSS